LGEDLYGKVVMLDCGISDCEKDQLNKILNDCNGIYCVKQDEIKEFFDGRI
jgi:hypothetical protein